MRRRRAFLRDEGGFALLMSLLLMLIMTALAAAMTVSGQTEEVVARNYEAAAQSWASAEAGLNHGLDAVIINLDNWQANGFASPSAAITALFLGPDGASGTAATDADNGSLEALGLARPPGTVAVAGVFGASYEVRVLDEDDASRGGVTLSAADVARIGEDTNAMTDANGQFAVQAIGYGRNNAMTTVEALVVAGGTTGPAILTNGDLAISGDAQILGSSGSVHSNSDLTISGNPDATGNLTATGSYIASGSPTAGGVTGGGHAAIPITPVQASDYLSHADYILTSTGQMTDSGGMVICDASSTNDACEVMGYGWVYNGGSRWVIGGSTTSPGSYYAEGPVTVSGNPGEGGGSVSMSIFAEGSIEISGNPYFTADSAGALFVTDGDLKINGSLNSLSGDMFAHEQLMISGNPVLAGRIVVEDAASISTLVDQNQISGTTSITYNGGGGAAAFSGFVASAWREIR